MYVDTEPSGAVSVQAWVRADPVGEVDVDMAVVTPFEHVAGTLNAAVGPSTASMVPSQVKMHWPVTGGTALELT